MRIHLWQGKAKPRPGRWSLGQNPVEVAWEADLPPAPQNEKGCLSGVRCEGACCSSQTAAVTRWPCLSSPVGRK